MEFNLRHRYGVAFHYKSLFEENVVVCNTFENGKWGAEERSGALPFKKDQLFQVGRILILFLFKCFDSCLVQI